MSDSSGIVKSLAASIDDVALAGMPKPEVPAAPNPTPADRLMGTVGEIAGVVATPQVMLGLPLGLGALSWLGKGAHKLNFTRIGSALQKPGAIINKPVLNEANTRFGVVTDAAFSALSVVGMYGIASSFSEKLASLKLMYADLTGRNVNTVSTAAILTGSVPKLVAEARKHLLLEHGGRTIFNAISGIISVRGLMGKIGKWHTPAQMGSGFANMGFDYVMGESHLMKIYKGIRDHAKRGLNVDDAATLIFASNKEMQARGDAGMQVARRIAELHYANKYKPTMPGQVLRDIENGIVAKHINEVKKLTIQTAPPAAGANAKTNPATPNTQLSKQPQIEEEKTNPAASAAASHPGQSQSSWASKTNPRTGSFAANVTEKKAELPQTRMP